jgi:hypothetical protein
MNVKTLGSTCLLFEIHLQKGRHANNMCTCTHSLPTFLASPSNLFSLLYNNFVLKKFHIWETPIIIACPLKKHIR